MLRKNYGDFLIGKLVFEIWQKFNLIYQNGQNKFILFLTIYYYLKQNHKNFFKFNIKHAKYIYSYSKLLSYENYNIDHDITSMYYLKKVFQINNLFDVYYKYIKENFISLFLE